MVITDKLARGFMRDNLRESINNFAKTPTRPGKITSRRSRFAASISTMKKWLGTDLVIDWVEGVQGRQKTYVWNAIYIRRWQDKDLYDQITIGRTELALRNLESKEWNYCEISGHGYQRVIQAVGTHNRSVINAILVAHSKTAITMSCQGNHSDGKVYTLSQTEMMVWDVVPDDICRLVTCIAADRLDQYQRLYDRAREGLETPGVGYVEPDLINDMAKHCREAIQEHRPEFLSTDYRRKVS